MVTNHLHERNPTRTCWIRLLPNVSVGHMSDRWITLTTTSNCQSFRHINSYQAGGLSLFLPVPFTRARKASPFSVACIAIALTSAAPRSFASTLLRVDSPPRFLPALDAALSAFYVASQHPHLSMLTADIYDDSRMLHEELEVLPPALWPLVHGTFVPCSPSTCSGRRRCRCVWR